jgi:polysaccharide pyruvyl transferase WcaK-like protein
MGLLGRLLPLAGLAASMRREVALLGIGVDRDMPRSTRALLGALGRRATSVVVRDEESRAILGELGVDATHAPDLSSRVPSAGREAGLRRLEAIGLQPRRRGVVGLALTAVRGDLVGAVERAVIEAVDALPDVDFCLVPMSRHPFVPRHNDALLARRIVAARPRVRVLVPPAETGELLGTFEAFGAAVCMRYHSLLFAERAGIPIVPFAYAEKCRHWLAERGLSPARPTRDAIVDAVRRAQARASA